MTDPKTLQLIRDYEGQIALYKLRIEHLEQQIKNEQAWVRLYTSRPEEMIKKLQVAGFPAIDVKDIYELLDEWHSLGGDPALLEGWREWSSQKEAVPA
jgi:hypothetical protein